MEPNKPISSETLAKWVRELSQGSVEAYSAIYRQYYHRLFRYALQIHAHPEVVEDILQDFFTYLAENCRKLRHVSNFEVYLFQSVRRNLLARLAREKQVRQSKSRYWLRSAPILDQAAAPADQQIIARESADHRRNALQHALAQLPEHQREILYLRYYEGMDYPDICRMLGLTYQVARNYASRGIRQLKETFEKLRS